MEKNMNKEVNEVTEQTPGVECDFCHSSEIHSLEWGPMYQLEGVTVHYFCLLFSAGLSQHGEDDEGILGFLPEDIRKELRRGEKLKCKFCKEPGATIGCSIKECRTSYHFPCGLKAKSSFQFTDNFESYCIQHKEVVEIPLPKRDWTCPICYSIVKEGRSPLFPPCCEKRVFHKRCILKMAKNHGSHFFKCPLCNDKDVFAEAMKKAGVYVPDRDATWETAPNAYEEHKRLYSSCDAQPDCHCPKGRDYNHREENHPWSVVRCGACGASAIHKSCGKLENLTWRCPTCAKILSVKTKSYDSNPDVIETTPVKKDISRIHRHQYDDDESDDISETESQRFPSTSKQLNSRNVEKVVMDNQTTDECSTNEDTDNESNSGVMKTTPVKKDISLKPQVVDLEEESDDSDLEVVCEKPCPVAATKSSVFLDMFRQSRKPELAGPSVISSAPGLSSAFQKMVTQARTSNWSSNSESRNVVDLKLEKAGPSGRSKKREGLKSGSVSDDRNSATSENGRGLRKRKK